MNKTKEKTYIFTREVKRWGVEAGDIYSPQHHLYKGGVEELVKKGIVEEEVQEEVKTKVESPPATIEGLNQSIKRADGESVTLQSVLSEGDYWQTNGRVKRTILTHNGVKKLADIAGVSQVVDYQILTQPSAMNNYQYTIMATVESPVHGRANEIGEANRSNLGSKGRGNPANMAQKRAYDRAIFRLLKITGLLSEEELADEEKEESMDGLSHEDKQAIAPIINQLLLASNNVHLIAFSKDMKEKAKTLTEPQLDYIRKLYSKRVGELTKKKF